MKQHNRHSLSSFYGGIIPSRSITHSIPAPRPRPLPLPLLLLLLLLLSPCSFLLAQKNQINADYLKSVKIRSVGPGAMSGRITAIAVDPNDDDVIYIGAASGGVWRSRSGGTAWEPIFDKAPTQSVGAIALNPRNPDDIWVGTGEGNPRNSQNFGAGIFRSLDGGRTWRDMGLKQTRTIHRVIVHRDNPDVVFVAAMGSSNGPNEDRGVFRTTDGGRTWRKVLYVNDLTGCADLVVDPSNPNKLYAAMWEYRRWPWYFQSGGKGSGLYVSVDGGETWTRRTNRDGLPEGELGRMGLAVAPSRPNIVYALVEAKDNALYKSTDGGTTWRKMAEKGMGDRPFYYSEIYVDPQNENRVYSVHTVITRSEDGGRSFDTWAGWVIHPDHHAFWINPRDPDHMIDGNDGGLNITHDGGRTWYFAENIPVGQFYHVNVDNELPYNIYGGLQDNGSWVGPSAVWRAGGLRNQYWQEVLFGDGFDVMPRRDNARYCYAMYQGGNLYYIDRETGHDRYIKPLHPKDEELRFNWNAALAQDPHSNGGIYYGSQYLHYSPDYGTTWQIISPDLTTNDTSKMHQERSGGLTPDATNAENYCTILAIAPSPSERGTVWVGTDDGRVQLTRDGGKTWTDLADRLPDMPKGAWVPQIRVSKRNAGEAWVVVNNYRLNDFAPYLYRTTDYGRKWQRLAAPKNLADPDAFVLSVMPDTEVPNLVFLGTDRGLYVSFDSGENWTKWPAEAFPSVPVQDMAIQERDGDLVLGTFGRAIWILDNLAGLRELARSQLALAQQPFKVLPPQEAVLASWASYTGARFSAGETWVGENRGTAVRIPVWVKPGVKGEMEKKEKDKEKGEGKKEKAGAPTDEAAKGQPEKGKKDKADKAIVTIFNQQGDTLRRFKTDLDTAFTLINWGLDTRGVRFPTNQERRGEDDFEPGGGPSVLPGTYKVVVQYGTYRDSTTVKVIDDPRLNISAAERQAQAAARRDVYKTVERAEKAYARLREAEKTLKLVEDQYVNVPDSTKKPVLKLAGQIRDSINTYKEAFFTQKEAKGIQRNPDNLNARLYRALEYVGAADGAPTANARVAIDRAQRETDALVARVNALFDGPWKEFRTQAEKVQYSLFKEWGKL